MVITIMFVINKKFIIYLHAYFIKYLSSKNDK